MSRIAYLLRIRPGKEAEYVAEHQSVWPELIDLLRSVGFRNYSIFRRGLNLFVYLEADDFQKSLEALTKHPLYQKWSHLMQPIMEPHPEIEPGESLPMLTEVFHLD